ANPPDADARPLFSLPCGASAGPALSDRLEQRDAGSNRGVQALNVSSQGDGHQPVASFTNQPPPSRALRADDELRRQREVDLVVRVTVTGLRDNPLMTPARHEAIDRVTAGACNRNAAGLGKPDDLADAGVAARREMNRRDAPRAQRFADGVDAVDPHPRLR